MHEFLYIFENGAEQYFVIAGIHLGSNHNVF